MMVCWFYFHIDGMPGDMLIASVTANLPASFMVWAASKEAKFLNGKFAWANWDVDELKAAATAIGESDKFTTGLLGWP
jgi:hypothetical protein